MKKLLNKGDVIRTNPKENFWGIAVVLSEKDKTEDRDPMCHIAITPLVFQHAVNFEDIDINKLCVAEFVRRIRLKPGEESTRMETLIGVYSRKIKTPIDIIGNIDPDFMYDGPLPFSPDYGLKVKWPLCGNVKNDLGSEAVITWRRINDSENFQKQSEESDRFHDALMLKIKEEERVKRQNAKLKKVT